MRKYYFLIFIIALFAPMVLAQTQDSTETSDPEPTLFQSRSVEVENVEIKKETDIHSPSSAEGDPDQPVITGTVPNTEDGGIEHEDIGIVEDEDEDDESDNDSLSDNEETRDGSRTAPSQIKVILMSGDDDNDDVPETTGIEGDDFGFFSNGKRYRHSGYMKIGDIKGESTDDGAKGNVEVEWKVEEGESAKEPDAIVVDGVTVRGWDPEKKEEIIGEAESAGKVVDEGGLNSFAHKLVLENENVRKLTVQNNQSDLEFVSRVRLFGFIPLNMREHVTLHTNASNPDRFGRVSVKFPWWNIFARKNIRADALRKELESAIRETEISQWVSPNDEGAQADHVPTETLSLNFSEIKARILDTAMSVIRNIGS